MITAQPLPRRMDVRMDDRMDARVNARMNARVAARTSHGRSHELAWTLRIARTLTMSCASLRGVRHVPLGFQLSRSLF